MLIILSNTKTRGCTLSKWKTVAWRLGMPEYFQNTEHCNYKSSVAICRKNRKFKSIEAWQRNDSPSNQSHTQHRQQSGNTHSEHQTENNGTKLRDATRGPYRTSPGHVIQVSDSKGITRLSITMVTDHVTFHLSSWSIDTRAHVYFLECNTTLDLVESHSLKL